jgi:hypothetical protein
MRQAPLLHSGDIHIGGSDVAGDDGGFRGLIRDLRIYKRALRLAEIKALDAAIPARKPAGRAAVMSRNVHTVLLCRRCGPVIVATLAIVKQSANQQPTPTLS